MTVQTLDANEYGSFSPKWMIRRLAENVPRENLEAAFSTAVEYIDALSLRKGVIDPQDALDALGQMLATQKYFPTAYPAPESSIQLTLADDEDDDEETPGEKWLRENAITEEEIEEAANDMSSWPDGGLDR